MPNIDPYTDASYIGAPDPRQATLDLEKLKEFIRTNGLGGSGPTHPPDPFRNAMTRAVHRDSLLREAKAIQAQIRESTNRLQVILSELTVLG